jgi:hypothetical protein
MLIIEKDQLFMKIRRDSNNFKDKIEIEPTLAAARGLVDTCLASAVNRPDLKKEPPAEAWFEIEGEDYLVSIGMREEKSNYVYVRQKQPGETPAEKPKGLFGFLKAASKAMAVKDMTGQLSKDQMFAFLAVVFTEDIGQMWSYLKPFAM